MFQDSNPLFTICIAKCITVHRAETAFLTHGCPPSLLYAHEQLWRIQDVVVSPISVNFPSCTESAESLVLMIQSTHWRIHLVMTARQTLGVQFPTLAAQFIYIQMMKNQLKNVTQNNKSYIQIQLSAMNKNTPIKKSVKYILNRNVPKSIGPNHFNKNQISLILRLILYFESQSVEFRRITTICSGLKIMAQVQKPGDLGSVPVWASESHVGRFSH